MRQIRRVKRVVIKVGTAVITENDGSLKAGYFSSIAKQISYLRDKGVEVVLVSSGAIGAGMSELKLKTKIRGTIMEQVCASVGQSVLIDKYRKAFNRNKIKVSQLLLTRNVFENKKSFINLKNCTEQLLKMKIVPIINENDVVAVDEIGENFGDNDYLSSLIAINLKADMLIMLSRVDGIYTQNPEKNKGSMRILEVNKITKEVEKYASGKSRLGRGGMKSKISAAKNCTKSGIDMVILGGNDKKVILNLFNGEDVGTYFYS